MSNLERAAAADPRIAIAGLRASGVIGAIGLGFLVAMFTAFAAGARPAGMAFGWVNDVTGVVTLPLALPGVLALHARVRPRAGTPSDALLLVGIGAGGTIVVLQVLLVTGAVPFEQQIGPVSVAFLVLAVFFVLYGRLAARHGILPGGTRLGLLAASYAGYPVWAFRIARTLEAGETATAAPATGVA
jgi:hypothetical protein